MASSSGPNQSHVTVLLLGETQSGKSSAGNAILRKTAFPGETTTSSKEATAVFGTHVTVVDTPGWTSSSPTPGRVSRELRRAVTLCHPEPDAILLVLPASATFSQAEWRVMEAQLRLLQTPIWQRAMVLFTHGDKLGRLPIREHIRRQGWTLHWLLERCGNRYQVLSNQPGTSEAQVAELFEKIRRMMEVNRRPRELQQRMYTQLRRELCMAEGRRLQEMEMTVMHDGRRRERTEMVSGYPHTGRWEQVIPRTPGFKGSCELGLVLLGRRKSGKSSAGNTILDRDEFQTDQKTSRCSVGRGTASGRPVTVVDTPGWSLFGLANPEQVKAEIIRSPSLCPAAGSRVRFLLAVPVGPFGEKDRRAVEMFLGVLGSEVWRKTTVVFTYGEELGGRRVEDHIQKNGEALRWVLDRCGRRYHVLDSYTGDNTQVDQLLKIQPVDERLGNREVQRAAPWRRRSGSRKRARRGSC